MRNTSPFWARSKGLRAKNEVNDIVAEGVDKLVQDTELTVRRIRISQVL